MIDTHISGKLLEHLKKNRPMLYAALEDECEHLEPMKGIPFDDWYDLYAKKLDRKWCETRWRRLSKSDQEKIMRHTADYVNQVPDPQSRRDPKKYLNEENYRDEQFIETRFKSTEQRKADETGKILGQWNDIGIDLDRKF